MDPIDDTSTSSASAASLGNEEFPMTLQEYCIHRSQRDNRVELIGAFEHTERVAGAPKATASEFDARFEAFVTQPA